MNKCVSVILLHVCSSFSKSHPSTNKRPFSHVFCLFLRSRRWGVRDEATDEHLTSQLCMHELAECRRLSMGPTFVSLQSHKVKKIK